MSRPVSQQIKNLKGGISQQPENLRYPNQGDVQINCWSSEAEGLQKRPPTVFVKKLDDYRPAHGKAFFHMINRDDNERYVVMFCGSTIRAFGLDGTEFVVNGATGHPYVQAAAPRDTLRAITVADYTFVVNRDYVVTEDITQTHPTYGNLKRQALINVRGGQYGRNMVVTINKTVVASIVIPDGSQPAHVLATDSQDIINKMVAGINSAHGTWLTAVGGIGHIALTSTVDITSVETSDGYAGSLLSGIGYQISNMNKLPVAAPNGFLVEVTGEVSGTGDAYWVMYSDEKGMWRETVAPKINSGFSATSMPHALIREANGTFTFRPTEWTPRLSGDDSTNPMPSFVGRTINDVFYFRNRLGFLSGENVVMSKSGKYFDHFPASVAVINDDDPIDISVSHNQISELKYAVPFSEQLLLWSQEAQFVLSASGSTLTSRTANLELTTEFFVSDAARPFGIDRGVFFVSPRATYSSIKRYYMVQDVSNVKSAEDISAHVPNYIPNNVYQLQGSGTENFLLCLTDDPVDRQAIFIYKYLYMNEQLVQQAWSHWEFGEDTDVLGCFCIGSFMWVILKRGGSLVIERVEFTKDTTDFNGEPYRTHMDMKVVCPVGVYDIDEFKTTFSFTDLYGYIPPKGYYSYVRQDGSFVPIEHDGISPTFSIREEVLEAAIFGRNYMMTYKFSKFLPKTQADDGSVMTEDLGRLQLSRSWVNYSDTGSFEMQVSNGTSNYAYPTGGGRYGNTSVVLGRPVSSTDTMRFPVTGNAKYQSVWLLSENPTPVNIVGCGWEGRLIKRAQSI